ncbi:VOC family protein [Alicyclobacillus ferrooxydans]|uniref:Glyoxalase n=1 Tax=Alicyclobacillus ferrooxydans TaxID=471514 RepID=A0A0N8PPI5_9BACL|nr:VOC family protein [Alicyclobacillus ferrooxydans]KPV44421.1 glyoxalase [Alicyclobacillus ferrooxydans]
MPKLSPYIFSDNAREQAALYADALGGEVVDIRTFADMPGANEAEKDRVMHLVLKVGDATIYMADNGEKAVHRGHGLDLTLEFKTEEEARSAFEKLAQGGRVVMPLEQMFWGAVFGRLEDSYGVRWQISTEA